MQEEGHSHKSVGLLVFVACMHTKKTLGNLVIVKRWMVPRAGVEPARVAPLVFETSASTDSAIWAAS